MFQPLEAGRFGRDDGLKQPIGTALLHSIPVTADSQMVRIIMIMCSIIVNAGHLPANSRHIPMTNPLYLVRSW